MTGQQSQLLHPQLPHQQLQQSLQQPQLAATGIDLGVHPSGIVPTLQ
ncbi:hypothetical protein BDEG_27014 [Batrachochytrium dendrobatidis JEL423]|nr:hypothetical protein BDEG_27014 [Batrachochytrium dendrobatidis JEL423]